MGNRADHHLNEQALADRLGLSVRTLQRWRWKGKGPAYLKLGGRVVYRLEDVEAWELANRVGAAEAAAVAM